MAWTRRYTITDAHRRADRQRRDGREPPTPPPAGRDRRHRSIPCARQCRPRWRSAAPSPGHPPPKSEQKRSAERVPCPGRINRDTGYEGDPNPRPIRGRQKRPLLTHPQHHDLWTPAANKNPASHPDRSTGQSPTRPPPAACTSAYAIAACITAAARDGGHSRADNSYHTLPLPAPHCDIDRRKHRVTGRDGNPLTDPRDIQHAPSRWPRPADPTPRTSTRRNPSGSAGSGARPRHA